LKLHHFC